MGNFLLNDSIIRKFKTMTKEEILRTSYENKFSSPRYDKSVNKGMIQEYVFPAMEEYAKQQVLNFNKWKEKNKYVFNGIYYSNKSPEIGVQTWFNIEELYYLFLKETEND